MLDIKKWSTQWGGRELTVEVGRMALQATAACTVKYGDTVMLATVVMSDSTRDIDYFPLMVSFEEKLYAAGKIKGSRFIKREGRPSDDAILAGRVIDRALRPLFDERIRNDIQVVVTALSVDQENDSEIVGLLAGSMVLALSDIPWNGPIGAARIGRKNGQFILNATLAEVKEGDLDLVISGTPEKLVMVESGAGEVVEADMLSAIKFGLESTAPVVELIKKAQAELGITRRTVEEVLEANGVMPIVEEVKKLTRDFVSSVSDSMIFNSEKHNKRERSKMIKDIKVAAKAHLVEKSIEEADQMHGLNNIKEFVSAEISKRILDKEQRLDGRSLTEIRELTSEIDLPFPRVHGTAMFMRGDTQVMSFVTLGAPGDVQTLDTMEEEGTKRYMHHYNDAPYTYGDVRPMYGPSRRAIGHGALAERAIEPVLPTPEDFPYAIRVVSEVMGSNGSSSMASTCGSSLSLMAAGVPIKTAVAGIAMGLATEPSTGSGQVGRWKVLTDLQDVEDGTGAMDFKIAGTKTGITAMQMDTKTHGITWEIIEKTINQAHEARMQILDVMNAAITEAKSEMSPYAPRIVTITIDPEKIRDVIGPGGKTINAIIDETGVSIDIEQDGRVMITSSDGEGMKKAIAIVKDLTREIMAGEEFTGKVVRLEDFGAFVNLLPGKDGLVHVSEISWERVNKPSDVLKMGQEVRVKVKEIDNLGRVNISMKVLMPKPEGHVDRPPMSRGPRPGGSGRPNGGNRGSGPRGPHGPRSSQHGGGSRGPQRDDAPRSSTSSTPMPKSEEPKKKGFFGRLKG